MVCFSYSQLGRHWNCWWDFIVDDENASAKWCYIIMLTMLSEFPQNISYYLFSGFLALKSSSSSTSSCWCGPRMGHGIAFES